MYCTITPCKIIRVEKLANVTCSRMKDFSTIIFLGFIGGQYLSSRSVRIFSILKGKHFATNVQCFEQIGKMKFHHSTHIHDNVAEKTVIDKQKAWGSTGIDSKRNTLHPIIANYYLSADVINSALRNMLPHCRRHRLVKFLLQC